ncbi:MAG: putative phage abortive infection protein [Bacteroidales bacterium]|nr:putative phage abortive infection protein [Bacteroidales bacterium]
MQLFKDNNGRLKTKAIFWVAVCIVIIVCVAYFLFFYFVVHVNMEKRGQFGDMFGFIGALFSGLAFAGLIVTMLQQREDLQNQKDEIKLQRQDLEAQTEALKLQKEEIAQTNKELELQRKEMVEQNKTIILQRFENTFFNMLELQQTIVNELRYELVNVEYKGRNVLSIIYKQIQRSVYDDKQLKPDDSIGKYLQCYYAYVSNGNLDHYFRHLYRIIKFVDESRCLTNVEKYNYLCLLRAQLSKDELLMLFYNGLSDYGNEKFKPLIEKYAIFKNIRSNFLLRDNHYALYASGAYDYSA